MKIGKSADIQQTDALSRPAQSGARPVAENSTGNAVEKAAPVDAVSLSQTSRSLAAESGETIPVHAAKVEEIKSAIREGRFHVNAAAVADKMIAQAAELLETLTKK